MAVSSTDASAPINLSAQELARAMQAGFDAHLTKPAAPDALLETVDKMLA